jgi:hypothetical protein
MKGELMKAYKISMSFKYLGLLTFMLAGFAKFYYWPPTVTLLWATALFYTVSIVFESKTI